MKTQGIFGFGDAENVVQCAVSLLHCLEAGIRGEVPQLNPLETAQLCQGVLGWVGDDGVTNRFRGIEAVHFQLLLFNSDSLSLSLSLLLLPPDSCFLIPQPLLLCSNPLVLLLLE